MYIYIYIYIYNDRKQEPFINVDILFVEYQHLFGSVGVGEKIPGDLFGRLRVGEIKCLSRLANNLQLSTSAAPAVDPHRLL